MNLDETIVGKTALLGVPIAAYFFLFVLYMAYLKVKPNQGNIEDEELKPKNAIKNFINLGIILLLSGIAAQAINNSYNITNFSVKS